MKWILPLLLVLSLQPANAETLTDVRKRMEQMRVDLIKDQLLLIKTSSCLTTDENKAYQIMVTPEQDLRAMQDQRRFLGSLTVLIVNLGGTEQLSDSDMRQLQGLVPPIESNESR